VADRIYSKEELEDIMQKIARVTAKETVRETFRGLGVDMEDPISVQHDFAFVRELRTTLSCARRRAVMVLVGIGASACAGAIGLGIKAVFTN
jgi:hypothetical protein